MLVRKLSIHVGLILLSHAGHDIRAECSLSSINSLTVSGGSNIASTKTNKFK